ncbi:hypothetical protein SAMN04490243_2305 [Robiginitalea myxolifaciens]|uniref:Uncharacterized protein n=1 Tax=Robiginitalea myxolifaciens TaxID=400055 RepID=A0A1I6H5L2_9FLAO|nr:hypothetical protein SAMN04490243_2305 [Robiginitalea myxolifaciens]
MGFLLVMSEELLETILNRNFGMAYSVVIQKN